MKGNIIHSRFNTLFCLWLRTIFGNVKPAGEMESAGNIAARCPPAGGGKIRRFYKGAGISDLVLHPRLPSTYADFRFKTFFGLKLFFGIYRENWCIIVLK